MGSDVATGEGGDVAGRDDGERVARDESHEADFGEIKPGGGLAVIDLVQGLHSGDGTDGPRADVGLDLADHGGAGDELVVAGSRTDQGERVDRDGLAGPDELVRERTGRLGCRDGVAGQDSSQRDAGDADRGVRGAVIGLVGGNGPVDGGERAAGDRRRGDGEGRRRCKHVVRGGSAAEGRAAHGHFPEAGGSGSEFGRVGRERQGISGQQAGILPGAEVQAGGRRAVVDAIDSSESADGRDGGGQDRGGDGRDHDVAGQDIITLVDDQRAEGDGFADAGVGIREDGLRTREVDGLACQQPVEGRGGGVQLGGDGAIVDLVKGAQSGDGSDLSRRDKTGRNGRDGARAEHVVRRETRGAILQGIARGRTGFRGHDSGGIGDIGIRVGTGAAREAQGLPVDEADERDGGIIRRTGRRAVIGPGSEGDAGDGGDLARRDVRRGLGDGRTAESIIARIRTAEREPGKTDDTVIAGVGRLEGADITGGDVQLIPGEDALEGDRTR